MTNELTQQPKSNRRTIVGTIVAIVVAILCVIYMLNPTAGFLEFIPDNLPLSRQRG